MLLYAAIFYLLKLHFSFSLLSQFCAYSWIRFMHINHLVGFRTTSCLGLTTIKDENVPTFWERKLEMSPGVLKNTLCCDLYRGHQSGSFVGFE